MEVIIMINYGKLGCHSGRRFSSVTLKYSHSPHIYSVLTAENVYVYSRKNLISNWKITFHNVSCHIVRHSVKGNGTIIRSILIYYIDIGFCI